MKIVVESAFKKFRCCAVFLEKIIDVDGIHIPHNTIHQILKSKGLAEEQPKKRNRRKWVRYERTYSNSMWHTDWKLLDDARWLICYQDDASRFIIHHGIFENATSKNAIIILRQAIVKHGRPASILTDHGSQFYANKSEYKRRGATQFDGMDEMKFAMREGEQLVQYLIEHPEISDVLFTGGDPMIMNAKMFSKYIDTLIDAKLPNLKTIRIGTKALSYWPYKFLTDSDSQEMLGIFRKITDNGLHLAFMAHFNHLNELSTDSVKSAIEQVRATGAQIRTQSPLLAHINDDAEMWAKMWTKQVQLGCIPYYMFVVRDTGAQHYFGISLIKAHDIFKKAYSTVSGLARTVRGPSMSATPGKVHVIGTAIVNDQKVIVLRFLQGRNPNWVETPFFAKYDENVIWLDDLKPAFTEKFFFEDELNNIKTSKMN